MKNLLLTGLLFLYINVNAQDKFVYVFLNSNPNKAQLSQEKVDSLQRGHLKNIQKLAVEDKLLVAGPFDGGGGIFIMNTASVNEAKQWIATDPAIAANRYRIEILPWNKRTGKLCLVDSTSSFVTYTFVRYNTHITKFNVQQAPRWFKAHDDYLAEIKAAGNVISEGVFDNSDGGVMVMKGDVQPEVIMNDPAVKNGIIQPEIKKIWVGKGAFCE